ncbi:MAG: hydrolase 2, exosortase A system-associated [Lysobacteraceae bacterium]|nr:MAG: hydrolase 2, exosortase A system-associated [Xanthomonadaceae bacterium]
MKAPGTPPADAFFLESEGRQRFCLYHPPAGPARGAVLYVHPFAEELNRTRRMAAMQARALAVHGFGVLQIDLTGCGDSSGDFGDARWELWKDDLAAGAAWLRQRVDGRFTLWGLRLGALLALDYARGARHPVDAMLLWQPVLKGTQHLNQFLRLHMAGALLTEGNGAAHGGTEALRATLHAGGALEIAGYELAPQLARALEALPSLEALAPTCPVDWIETVSAAGQEAAPGALRAVAAWRAAGVGVRLHPVQCAPFWATSEITENTAWIDATSDALLERMHGT